MSEEIKKQEQEAERLGCDATEVSLYQEAERLGCDATEVSLYQEAERLGCDATEVEETKGLLESIDEVANRVAKEDGVFREAIQEENRAEVELLSAVIEKVRPALPALANRIRCSCRCWWVGSVRTENEEHHFAWRGLYLRDDKPGPCRENPTSDQNRGSYEGLDVFLVCSDKDNPDNVGRFALVEYEGHWSRWQGESDEWEATVEIVSAEQVLEHLKLERIIEVLNKALTSQLEGAKTKRSKQAIERAERVRALARLL